MSIILDEDSVNELKEIILKIEEHLKTKLSKVLYERNDGTTTIYPKIIGPCFTERIIWKSILWNIFEKDVVKAVLEIEGIILKEDGNASLQVKIYKAKGL